MESKSTNEDDVEIHDPRSFDFDLIIGCIEDAIISEEFEIMQKGFLSEHCSVFNNCEENQLYHTDIFNNYTQLIEGYLNEKILMKVPQFSMQQFSQELKSRKEPLQGEIFEILAGLTDFLSFKEMMLHHKFANDGFTNDFKLIGSKIMWSPTINILNDARNQFIIETKA